MPGKVEDPWYDSDHEVRRVRTSGDIKWRGEHVFIGEALAGEVVGLTERDQGRYVVSFSHRALGVIDPTKAFHRFAPPRARRGETVETNQE